MAIDLQNPQNIGSGWGPPPQFHAPEIGGLVGHILQNRLLQKAQQDKEIAQAVKAMQEQRQQNAYASALRDTGLSEGQDLSGVSSTDQTRIAQLLQARTPDTDRDALVRAQTARLGAATNKENTIADYIKQYGTTPGAGAGASRLDENGVDRAVGETWIGSDGKERIMTFNRGPKLTAVGLQPSDQRTQNENQMLKEQSGLLEQKGLMDADVAKEKAANEQLNKRDVPYSKSEQYNRMVNRLKQIQQMRTAPSTQPDAAPQPSPAETGDALPTSTPIPTGKGADQNLASGFGKKVSDEDVAALGWARANPDDPRSAAILRKLGIQ